MNVSGQSICDRLRLLRIQKFGPRGKAQFAKRLGIRASTYQQYESNRVPPVDLLIRAAELTHSDLLWLLTGDNAGKPGEQMPAAGLHPVITQVRELLERRPEAAQSLQAFVTLIDPEGPSETEPEEADSPDFGQSPVLTGSARDLVPVIGSTAAGTARYWRELVNERKQSQSRGDAATRHLERLFEEISQRTLATDARLMRDAADPLPDSTAALIQFAHPDDLGLVEFLSCPGIDQSHLPLVGWRIDGESMMPRYRDGDFVLVSPERPAAEGFPCVAHQHGQIGVNCKIFKRDGEDVVLIPVNEAYAAQRFPASELAWAHRVLFSIRLKPRQMR